MTQIKPILFHAYSGALGGSEKILLDLLRRLRRPAVLACPPGQLADAAEGDGLTVIRLKERPLEARGGTRPASAMVHLLGHGREVGSLTGDLEPALVVSWGMRSAIASTSAMRKRRVPIVAEHVDLLPPGRQGALARKALLSCDRVVCLSNSIARDLDPAWHATGRVTVVHPGVDLPTVGDRPHPVPAKALILAALEPWKGQDLALEAAAPIDGLELVIAGSTISGVETDYSSSLRQRAAQPDLVGRVSFPGWVDPNQALAESTLLLHTAPDEPFGRALIDALAMGRPVIAFDSAGPSEILTPDCGRLVPRGDIPALTTALRELAADPHLCEAMGSAGRRRVAADFDSETQALRWQRAALSLAPVSPRAIATGPTALNSALVDAKYRGPGSGISLVTVIHDSAPDLARLLASVSRHMAGAEVIVVDSGSTDGGSSVASTWAGEAKVVQLEGNLGYGAGCNEGLAHATRHTVALINPDVELVDSSLADLADELQLPGGELRIFSPMLLHPDGRRQDAVHPLPGTAPELARALLPASLLPGRFAQWLEPHRLDAPQQVGWAVGACLVARADVLRALGPFDPSVHLYAEDLDLCLRARDLGIETWYRPDCRVIHREAHSTRQAFGGEPSELLAKRRRTVVAQRMGSSARRRDDAIQILTNLDRATLKKLSGRDASRELARLRAIRKARRNG